MMKNSKNGPVLAVVVPCYNEEEVLMESAAILQKFLQTQIDSAAVSEDSYILMVDDGSKDRTWSEICALHDNDPIFRGLKLAHNRGHQNALYAGLMEARKDCDLSISIDADLQDDVESMAEMIRKAGEGANIVFGVRNDRTTDTVMKRTTADWYYRTLNALGVHTIPQHADFRLMDREALEALSQYREVNLFLRGIATDIGLKTDRVYYSRKARTAGESKYSLKKMLLLAEDGVTSFSTAPLKISFGFGAAADGAALVLLFRAMRDRKSQAGIMALICFMQSIQFYLSGILGTYIGKTYTEVKDRPRYYIQERTGEK